MKKVPPVNDLKSSGLKNTRYRHQVLQLLKTQKQGLTADEIFLKLSRDENSLSLSTIYRILQCFVSRGILSKSLPLHYKKALYEIQGIQHQHALRCLSCDKTIPIEDCPLKALEQTLSKKTSYKIIGHRMDIYGYCPDCQKKV